MDEKKIRKIVQEEIMKEYVSGTPRIPPHKHNGNDNLHIRESDIISNTKFQANLRITYDPINPTEPTIFTFQTITNPTRLTFHGFVRYPSTGTVVTRVMVNGEADFGVGYKVTDFPNQKLATAPNGIVQCCNYFSYTVTGVGTSTSSVGFTSTGIVHTPSADVHIEVSKWTDKTVVLKTTILVDAQIQGSFIIT